MSSVWEIRMEEKVQTIIKTTAQGDKSSPRKIHVKKTQSSLGGPTHKPTTRQKTPNGGASKKKKKKKDEK